MELKKLCVNFALLILMIFSIGCVIMIGFAAWVEYLPPHPSERQEVIEYYPAIRQ